MVEIKRFELVDFLKGFSIFTIVLYHLISFYDFYEWSNVVKFASTFGGAGVHVFFVCSGFGLYLSHLKKGISFGQFVKKKFSRVYIPYAILVLVSFLLPNIYPKDGVPALASHLLLYKMFVPAYSDSFGGHLWFISTIIQFYLVFYILIKTKEKLGNKKYLILSIVISVLYGLVVAALGKQGIRTWNSFFLQYLWEFSVGMVLAEYYKNGKLSENKLSMKKVFIAAVLGTGITGITGYLGGAFKLFNDYASLVGYGSIALFIYLMKIGFVNKFFIWLSSLSYEWYLIHGLIFQLFAMALPKGSSLLLFTLVFIVSIPLALVYKTIVNYTLNTFYDYKKATS